MIETIIFSIIGICIGSFLNVVIIRIPQNENIAFPSSHCVHCNNTLKWYHNIPIFSWVFLGGKCAYCKEKISIQYPLVEILTGIIFAISYVKSESLLHAAIIATVFTLLLALSTIDLKYKAVPDSLSLPALIIALFSGEFLPSLESALILAGGLSLLRIFVSWIIKKEAMGEADIIIAAVIGAMVGVELGLSAIYISAVISLPVFMIVSKKGFELPFIPFLSLGLFLTWIYQTQILELLELIYE